MKSSFPLAYMVSMMLKVWAGSWRDSSSSGVRMTRMPTQEESLVLMGSSLVATTLPPARPLSLSRENLGKETVSEERQDSTLRYGQLARLWAVEQGLELF